MPAASTCWTRPLPRSSAAAAPPPSCLARGRSTPCGGARFGRTERALVHPAAAMGELVLDDQLVELRRDRLHVLRHQHQADAALDGGAAERAGAGSDMGVVAVLAHRL